MVVTSSEGLPDYAGMRLVEDLGVVQRYEAVDGEGMPVSVLVLGEHASRDPQQRAAFVQHAMQASVAALPGQLPITFYDDTARPWAASPQEQGAVGVERLLPGVLAQPARDRAPQPDTEWAPQPDTDRAPQPDTHHVPRPAASRTPMLVALAGVALLLVVGLVAAVAATGRDDEPVAAPIPTRDDFPLLPTELPPLPSILIPEAPPTLEGPRPTLKDVPPVTVLGPGVAPGEGTRTFDFPGWPFAFRAPGTWGCLTTTFSVSDAYANLCVDEQNPGDRQRMTVMIRRCPTTCTPAEQEEMNRAWLDEPERAVAFDPSTVYVETPRSDRGTYSVDFSHFFAAAAGEPLSWQVGVYVESPLETRDEVLEILNEIRSQTP